MVPLILLQINYMLTTCLLVILYTPVAILNITSLAFFSTCSALLFCAWAATGSNMGLFPTYMYCNFSNIPSRQKLSFGGDMGTN